MSNKAIAKARRQLHHQAARSAAIEAAAKAGRLPRPPNFKARTHECWRPMLREVAALAKAGGLEALKGYQIKAYSTSPKAIARYRDLAIIALSTRSQSS